MSKRDEIPPESIPEVAKFIEIQQRYEQWRSQNQQFFDYLNQVSVEYNEALSAAETACRQRQVSCGPFVKYSVSSRYDADAMYDIYGREAFLELGGTLETVQKRGLDKKRVDFAITTGKIDPERAKLIKKEAGTYHKPGLISIP